MLHAIRRLALVIGSFLSMLAPAMSWDGDWTVITLARTGSWGVATSRAFCEKVESRWDSRESVFVIQASHWTGGQHEWGSHIRMTCDAASFKRLRLVIRTRKPRICAA
jgi:hypothetical protein